VGVHERRHAQSRPGILREHQAELIAQWTAELAADRSQRHDLIGPEEVREQASEFAGIFGRHPAIVAATLYRDARRPRDDAAVVVVRDRVAKA
jgi:cation transport regulator ChaB